ncbi:MAG: hypothetical protein AVDCRST_MAG30-3939 [uncultured Solirubrobacteraceae bacterium]|uniref:Uncharacterized protein n=1 Tax=uncultured Solirubrobacteraceae bacterium TaxID=1162706 RepID=A0A6J4TUV3_9ACTN|nr:MAG: hypothetical protein AVDCRST_MAG30-3939 [uncultured Solirubrobacteraceae bacterium]
MATAGRLCVGLGVSAPPQPATTTAAQARAAMREADLRARRAIPSG